MPENRSDSREQAREEEEVYWAHVPRKLELAVPHRCQMIDETNGQRCKAVASWEEGMQMEVSPTGAHRYAWHVTEVCDTHHEEAS